MSDEKIKQGTSGASEVLTYYPGTQRKTFDTPNSPTLDLFQKTVATSNNLPLMVKRQAEMDKRRKDSKQLWLFEDSEEKGKKRIKMTQKSRDYITTVTFVLPEEISIPQPAKKLMRYIITEVSRQAFNNGELHSDSVEFSLESLVEIGMYKNVEVARTMFKENAEILVSLLIEGERTGRAGVTRKIHKWHLGHVFRSADISNNICKIQLETQNDWNFIISQYEIMPKYSFRLSNRTYDLTETICYLARVNCKKILENGYLKINFAVLQQRLSLPEKSPNPGRDIIKPIYSSVEELQKQEENEPQYNIEINDDANLSIDNRIKNSFLKVFFYDEFIEKLNNWVEKRTKKIESVTRRTDFP